MFQSMCYNEWNKHCDDNGDKNTLLRQRGGRVRENHPGRTREACAALRASPHRGRGGAGTCSKPRAAPPGGAAGACSTVPCPGLPTVTSTSKYATPRRTGATGGTVRGLTDSDLSPAARVLRPARRRRRDGVQWSPRPAPAARVPGPVAQAARVPHPARLRRVGGACAAPRAGGALLDTAARRGRCPRLAPGPGRVLSAECAAAPGRGMFFFTLSVQVLPFLIGDV